MKDPEYQKIIQEYKGKKVELSLPVIGVDVHEFMEMVTGFMKATGWTLQTIKNGLESAADQMQEEIDVNKPEKEVENDSND